MVTAAPSRSALTVARQRCCDVPLAVAIVLVLGYPLVLLPLGFYLPAELTRLRRLVPVAR